MLNPAIRCLGHRGIQSVRDEMIFLTAMSKCVKPVTVLKNKEETLVFEVYEWEMGQHLSKLGVVRYGWLASGVPHFIGYYPYVAPFDAQALRTLAFDEIRLYKKTGELCHLAEVEGEKLDGNLIFRVINPNVKDYYGSLNCGRVPYTLTGFCYEAKILLPLQSMPQQERQRLMGESYLELLKNASVKGSETAEYELSGTEDAILDILGEELENRDLYALIDEYLLPDGVECDEYEALGTILEWETVVNPVTSETFYLMILGVKDMLIHIAVHDDEVEGLPKEGRRIRCRLKLSGYLHGREAMKPAAGQNMFAEKGLEDEQEE